MAQTYRITHTKNNITKSVNIKKYLLDYFALTSGVNIEQAKNEASIEISLCMNILESRFITADVISERLLLLLTKVDRKCPGRLPS